MDLAEKAQYLLSVSASLFHISDSGKREKCLFLLSYGVSVGNHRIKL